MLIPFVIEPEGIRQFYNGKEDEYEKKLAHNAFMKIWRKYGVLLFDGTKRETSNFFKVVEKLPEKYRDHWFEMLKQQNCPIGCLDDWNGEISPETLPRLNGKAMLALVDYLRAIDFDLDESDFEKVLNVNNRQISVCRAKALGQSVIVSERERLSEMHILKGELTQSVWNERFKGIASSDFVKQISIVDAYSVSRHFVPKEGEVSGLETFISMLAKCTTPKAKKVVKLFASDSDFNSERVNSNFGGNRRNYNIDADAIKDEFWNLWDKVPKDNFKKFDIIILKHRRFKLLAHDRFFRMESYVWDIGSGLEIFEGHNTSKNHSATFKSLPEVAKEYKEIEDGLYKDKSYVVDVLNF